LIGLYFIRFHILSRTPRYDTNPADEFDSKAIDLYTAATPVGLRRLYQALYVDIREQT
jgi:hypothetical protein